MRRLIALDLDGTLVDSAPDLSHCLGRALESFGLEPPGEARTREWIGDGVEMLVRRGLEHGLGAGFDESLMPRALEAFDACYRVNMFGESRLYDDVPETLDRLRALGCVLGCVTNKRFAFTERLLELAGIGARLDFVYGGDSCEDMKPSPAQLLAASASTGITPDDAVLVGDSLNDMTAAAAAGFEFVWAAYGYTASMAASAVRPRLRIERFRELLECLAAL